MSAGNALQNDGSFVRKPFSPRLPKLSFDKTAELGFSKDLQAQMVCLGSNVSLFAIIR